MCEFVVFVEAEREVGGACRNEFGGAGCGGGCGCGVEGRGSGVNCVCGEVGSEVETLGSGLLVWCSWRDDVIDGGRTKISTKGFDVMKR